MKQMLFAFETEPLPAEPVSNKGALKSVLSRNQRSAQQCRDAAERLQRHIDGKVRSADNMLMQRPTPKRLADSDHIRRQAGNLERLQSALRKLAELHEREQIPAELAGLTTRAAVEQALRNSPSDSAIARIFREAVPSVSDKAKALRMEREALLKNIPGFYPTPKESGQRLVQFAQVEPGNSILEPSAGSGALVDVLIEEVPDIRVSYCELNVFLLETLRLKYSANANIHFLSRDCEELSEQQCDGGFNRVIMNPPFDRGRDVRHVLRAFDFLAPGGILAAIVSEGSFSRSDKNSTTFHNFLRTHETSTIALPDDCFKAVGTRVRCRMVRVTKTR